MRKTRSVAAALAGVGLLLAGCAGGSGQQEQQPQASNGPSPLASFDPCTVLTQEQMQKYELRLNQVRPVDELGDVGCKIGGEVFFLGLYKAESDDLAYWESQRSNFAEFEKNRVGPREGIRGIANGTQGHGLCREIIEVAGGSVWVQVAYKSDKLEGSDPCGKALEIAQAIEPKLPR
ncbi:DUF3558 family protein [Saccharopolyspora hattusasensis]|uniref:DUF3558 family protein n=1 Tax=Saccharopolyspora hattusasensis TaxID=1128679 RepID=UPI003D9746EA